MSNVGFGADDATAASESRDSLAVRRSRRIAVHLPGFVSWVEGGMERIEAVSMTSINRFGCALRCHTFFQPGTRLRLECGDKVIQGHVVQSLKDYSVNLVTVGVAFDQDTRDFWPVGFELGR
jgi:hypothetical protein